MKGKLFAAFVMGAVAGAAGTYAYLTKIKKIEYEVVEPVMDEGEETTTNEETEDQEEETPDQDLMAYYQNKALDEDTIVDYTKFAETVSNVTDGTSVERRDPKEIEKRESKKYIISEEEYREECEEEQLIDTAAISVYSDGAVIDETNGMEIEYSEEEIDDFIGSDLMEMFKKDDSTVMYVKNEKYRTIYEVCKKEQRWLDMIGLGDEE